MRAGTFFEDEEDDALSDEDGDIGAKAVKKKPVTKYMLRDDDFRENLNLHDFEKAAAEICKPSDFKYAKNIGDEIPNHIRDELDLPANMGKQDIDFKSVRSRDC